MANQPTNREAALAAHIVALRGKRGRPKISGSGPLADTLNVVSERAPLALIRLALVIFLAYMAWGYYNRAQQMVFDLKLKDAELTKTQVEADSIMRKLNGETAQRATMKAEIARIKAEAATAEADAQAANAQIGGVSARLAVLRAEMETVRAEGDKAQAEADAQNQLIDGVPLAVAQKKSEIAAAIGEVKTTIQSLCSTLWSLDRLNEPGLDPADPIGSITRPYPTLSCPGAHMTE